MFKRTIQTALLMLSATLCTTVLADHIILDPPSGATGTPAAIIWIHGMQCKPEAYKAIATEVQNVAASQGLKLWVGLPEFVFDAPEPILIGHYVAQTFDELRKHGFAGDNVFMAAHSLGGVMTQLYVGGHDGNKTSEAVPVKGMMLMGSVLLRNTRHITPTGRTHFNFTTPTLTLQGSKDGLLRVTRGAEAYFHQILNIESSQQGKYPVVAFDGLSHSSFMDSSMLPSAVVNSDLKPEVEEAAGYLMVATAMTNFMGGILGDDALKQKTEASVQDSMDLLQPLLTAMALEGSYDIKDPCYGHDLVNPDTPTCLRGSRWSEIAQGIMGGDISDKNATLVTQDNFHRVYTVTPVHLPRINNTCDGTSACTIQSITVTENYYNRLSPFDTGKTEIGAVEIKAKLMSRQSVQVAAGNKTADFHENDEVGQRCGDINKKALQWALDHASPKAVERYNKLGKKLVIGDDLGPYNEGPLWIWTYLSYKDNKDKTETTLRAPMMRTPTNYPISAAAGFHYCKLLSPFRAIEWIYIDSLFDHDGLKPHSPSLFERVEQLFQGNPEGYWII